MRRVDSSILYSSLTLPLSDAGQKVKTGGNAGIKKSYFAMSGREVRPIARTAGGDDIAALL